MKMRGCIVFILALIMGCDGVGLKDPEIVEQLVPVWERVVKSGEPIQPLVDGNRVFYFHEDSLSSSTLDAGDPVWSISKRRGTNRIMHQDDDNLYFTDCLQAMAIRKSDGSTVWQKTFTRSAFGPNQEANDRYIACGGKEAIYLIEKATGEVQEIDFPNTGNRPELQRVEDVSLSDDGMLCASSWYDHGWESAANVFCFDILDGSVIWEKHYPAEIFKEVNGTTVWHNIAGRGAEIWEDNVIMSVGRYLDSYNRFTGEFQWGQILDGEGNWQVIQGIGDDLSVAPVAIGDTLFLGTTQGTVQARSLHNGELYWKIETSYWFRGHFQRVGDRLFFENGELHMVDANTGRTIWRGDPKKDHSGACYFSTPVVSGDMVVSVGCHRIYGLRHVGRK